MIENIVLQSAGSLSVAILALIMMMVQISFVVHKPQYSWYGWSAAISFSSLLYAVGIVLEYNTPPGSVNRFGGLLEFSAIILLNHCLFGFTFAYLKMDGKRYHVVAGIFHIILLGLLWFSTVIVADSYTSHYFIGLAKPFTEPALGPLGSVFILYMVGAAVVDIIIWLRHKAPDARYKAAYIAGSIFWFILGVHDGLAALGISNFQYVMEYGFFGFSAVILWVVFDSYTDRMAEDKYSVITKLANDGILVLQNDATVFENPACSDLFGQPVAHFETKDFISNIVPEDRGKVLQYYSLLTSKVVSDPLVFRIERPDGDVKNVEVRASIIRYRNRPAVLTVMRDVTQRIRREEALKEQEEKLVRLKKMESLGLLAGGVAHDLNNVLSGIVSYPELLLLQLPEDSKLRRPLDTIRESGLRAAAIVQDLLTVARGVIVPKAPLNLNTVIHSYLSSPEHKKLLRHHPSVTIKSTLDSQLLNINGSPVHLQKVVMNLISNASEAIESRGTVWISTMNRYVDRPVRGYEIIGIGEYAILRVENDGPAISSDDLKRIFEPFYTKKVMGRSGTGLGLTVVWNVVRDHEGYIDVISDDRSSKFELYFPVTREAVTVRKPSESFASLKGNGETILVIDDEKSQREILCMMLEALGYKASAVENGEAAVAYIKQNDVDLLLLDMIMEPGINGRETYARIKEIRPLQKAVIISGFPETEEVQAAVRLGAGVYLKKPLVLEALGRSLKETLSS